METKEYMKIPVNKIKVLDNSRIDVRSDGFVELLNDIKSRGLLQPIGVFFSEGNYFVRYGHRRLEVFKELGYTEIPACIINRDLSYENLITDNLAENIHRKSITPVEAGTYYKKLIDLGKNVSEISVMLSIPKTRVVEALQLVDAVPEKYKKEVKYSTNNRNLKGKISAKAATAILKINFSSSEEKERVFFTVKKEEWSILKINLLKLLMREGKTFDKSVEIIDDYTIVVCNLVCKKKELENYKDKSYTNIIKRILKGKEKVNPNLILTKL